MQSLWLRIEQLDQDAGQIALFDVAFPAPERQPILAKPFPLALTRTPAWKQREAQVASTVSDLTCSTTTETTCASSWTPRFSTSGPKGARLERGPTWISNDPRSTSLNYPIIGGNLLMGSTRAE
jgi:hypothetical protein